MTPIQQNFGLGGWLPATIEGGEAVRADLPAGSDDYWMWQALKLSMTQVGLSAPNPSVGCLFVKEGLVVAAGATEAYGGRHGERVAYDSLADKSSLEGSTCFVTLEPCCHAGKQPPCTDLLVEAKIKRCVIAIQDPFSAVNGGGIERLQRAGITVETGVLGYECGLWHLPFLFHQSYQRPLMVAKWAQTIDGCLVDDQGQSQWITGAKARQHSHFLRQKYDAIMVGGATVLADVPSLDVRDSPIASGRSPVKIIIDPRGSLGKVDSATKTKISRKTFSGQPSIYCGPSGSWIDDQAKVSVISCSWDALDLDFINQLSQQYRKLTGLSLQSVMIEGGARLISQLLEQGLIDAFHIFVRASFMGGQSRVKAQDTPLSMANKLDLQLVNSIKVGQDCLMDSMTKSVYQQIFKAAD